MSFEADSVSTNPAIGARSAPRDSRCVARLVREQRIIFVSEPGVSKGRWDASRTAAGATHLVSNTAQYGQTGKRMDVDLAVEANQVRLSVENERPDVELEVV